MRAAVVAGWVLCSACAHPGAHAVDASPPTSASAPAPVPTQITARSAPFIEVPGGAGGIGFDDLGFARSIRRVLVPAANTGQLALVDPDTLSVTRVEGFSKSSAPYAGGHDVGVTSADEGRGLLFATDRSALELDVVDPPSATIVARAKLGAGPDYVRWVGSASEVWVTEPDRDRIEVFSLPKQGQPTPVHSTEISVPGGPESLVIDETRKRAYAHLWKGATVAVDIATHAVVARWPNGCTGSRGIALDAARGLLFAGCAEGKLSVLDVQHGGKLLGSVASGAGVDVIAYDAKRSHVYLPGARSATMAIVRIAEDGTPSVLATVRTAGGAHCVTADDRGFAWVCDPKGGRLLRFLDAYP
jgi:DNA-binding beta-propeller fold protein YncE